VRVALVHPEYGHETELAIEAVDELRRDLRG
jgi:hypothetical protein